MFKKEVRLAWIDNSIRVIRRHVLSLTDEKSFDLGSVGRFPHIQTNLAKKTRRFPSCQNHKSPSTTSVTFQRSPSVICSVDNEPNIRTVHSSYQTGIRENNSINSHAQDTTFVQPNVFS